MTTTWEQELEQAREVLLRAKHQPQGGSMTTTWEQELEQAREVLRHTRGKCMHGAMQVDDAKAREVIDRIGPELLKSKKLRLVRLGNSKLGEYGRHAQLMLTTRGLAGPDCPHRTDWCSEHCYAGIMIVRGAGMRFTGGHGVGLAYSYLAHNHPEQLSLRLLAEVDTYRSERGYPKTVMRMHDAGDFVSPAHVQAYTQLAQSTPDVTYFGFTRAWRDFRPEWVDALHELCAQPNVALRASLDQDAYDMPEGRNYYGTAAVGVVTPRSFFCLEQANKIRNCADCGACWKTKAGVLFREH